MVTITTKKPFIVWHSSPEQTSRMLPVRSSAIFRKPWGRFRPSVFNAENVHCLSMSPGVSNRWKSMIEKPIDNHTNLRHRLVIDCQYQSINFYQMVLIDIDCHRLSFHPLDTLDTRGITVYFHPSFEFSDHSAFCFLIELLSSSSPSLAPPSAVVTYPSATYTSQLSSAASVTATKSPLYPSPTSYTSSATVTYPSSTKKPFSSSPQSHSSDHINRPFPYWAVATTAAAGAIIVFLVVYIVLKKCKKDRRTTLKYLQADYPQDMEESISEGMSIYTIQKHLAKSMNS